jgi:hypothetical protein
MNSGPTRAGFTFGLQEGPDFDVNVEIDDTDLTKLNDLFRAYGDFRRRGRAVQPLHAARDPRQRIDGYLKPSSPT